MIYVYFNCSPIDVLLLAFQNENRLFFRSRSRLLFILGNRLGLLFKNRVWWVFLLAISSRCFCFYLPVTQVTFWACHLDLMLIWIDGHLRCIFTEKSYARRYFIFRSYLPSAGNLKLGIRLGIGTSLLDRPHPLAIFYIFYFLAVAPWDSWVASGTSSLNSSSITLRTSIDNSCRLRNCSGQKLVLVRVSVLCDSSREAVCKVLGHGDTGSITVWIFRRTMTLH